MTKDPGIFYRRGDLFIHCKRIDAAHFIETALKQALDERRKPSYLALYISLVNYVEMDINRKLTSDEAWSLTDIAKEWHALITFLYDTWENA